jgi:hypothetical protein
MNNCFSWGEFELPILLGILNDCLPREIEFYEVLIEGTIERCISLDDIEMVCRAILEAFQAGVEEERLIRLVPRAKMMLEQIDRLKLDDARD